MKAGSLSGCYFGNRVDSSCRRVGCVDGSQCANAGWAESRQLEAGLATRLSRAEAVAERAGLGNWDQKKQLAGDRRAKGGDKSRLSTKCADLLRGEQMPRVSRDSKKQDRERARKKPRAGGRGRRTMLLRVIGWPKPRAATAGQWLALGSEWRRARAKQRTGTGEGQACPLGARLAACGRQGWCPVDVASIGRSGVKLGDWRGPTGA